MENTMQNTSECSTEIKRLDVGQRMSEAAIYNGTVYLAGQVASDASLDITGQMNDVLQQIDSLLARAGSDKTRILMAQIFISDLTNFSGMNIAWDAWVAQGHNPPRATVEAKLAKPEWLVEVVVTAALK